VPVADLVAQHGSPLWSVNLDVLRDRWRTLASTWNGVWPDVRIAYSHKANRHPAIVSALAAEGAWHQVSSGPEYELARTIAEGDGHTIVLHDVGLARPLLERAAADDALVIADSAGALNKAIEAGVRRLGVRVTASGVSQGPALYGVPAAEVPALVRLLPAGAPGLEALALHFVPSSLKRPQAEASEMIRSLHVDWPNPPEHYASAARALASLAMRLGVPVVDIGGGFPPAPDEWLYARAVAGALGGVGFDGRLVVEPGRALAGEAVDLVCSVCEVKRLEDGTRCVVVDAGLELVPGGLFRWPHIDALGPTEGPKSPAMVIGSHSRSHDILHPAANLPPVGEGDLLVLRRVGAYNQSESTEHGALQAGVMVRDGGDWTPWEGATASRSRPPASA
jgi:diaminopimelate decarboxylase